MPLAKFSIILPVKNGGDYVKKCVQSILAQTYPDFTLLILENQSTDGTGEWAQSLTDDRVKVYPAEKALTIEENWKRATAIPKNEYMTLIGHDDILHNNFLETINNLIEKYPEASLFFTHFSYIDADGNILRDCKLIAEKETASAFLANFLRKETDVMGTGFVMRSRDYDAIGGIPLYPNLLFADFELWIRLTKISFKVTSSSNCFSFRIHNSTTTLSPDTKYHEAFGRFISFLHQLYREKDIYRQLIKENGPAFLAFYCRGLSHRLLRTPKDVRNGLTVSKFISACRQYAEMLGFGKSFRPYRVFSILIAALIDRIGLLRSIFLSFKKRFPKPILK